MLYSISLSMLYAFVQYIVTMAVCLFVVTCVQCDNHISLLAWQLAANS